MKDNPYKSAAGVASAVAACFALGQNASARELYNHDTGKTPTGAPLTSAQQQCNQDVFGGTILAETKNPTRRATPAQQADADGRLFNCMHAYGQGRSPMMMVVEFSRQRPQNCTLFLYTVLPGETPDTHKVSRERFECVTSRPSSAYGPDPQAAFNLDMIWPVAGGRVPELLQRVYPNIQPLESTLAPFFFEFDRDAESAARGIHGFGDTGLYGGSSGCVRLTPRQAEGLMQRFEKVDATLGTRLQPDWWRNTTLFFVEKDSLAPNTLPQTAQLYAAHMLGNQR
jgi:hypothetical protein